jgi:transcriptional regulator with XRE-family HTH domain
MGGRGRNHGSSLPTIFRSRICQNLQQIRPGFSAKGPRRTLHSPGRIRRISKVLELMNASNTERVGDIIRQKREAQNLSVRGLAAAARVDASWLSKVEHGIYENPNPRYLHRLAQVLGIETETLFVAANYSDGLPGFAPYLRTKYALPTEAIEQLRAHFELLADKYDRDADEEGGTDAERHPRAA